MKNYTILLDDKHIFPAVYNNVGHFGKVFKAVYKRPGGSRLPVAIKTLKQYESEKEKESFQREMAVMKKLMHPNIVRLFGLVQQGILACNRSILLACK